MILMTKLTKMKKKTNSMTKVVASSRNWSIHKQGKISLSQWLYWNLKISQFTLK